MMIISSAIVLGVFFRAYYLLFFDTRIQYLIPDTSGIHFLINRVATLGQMLVPLELTILSLSYAPFILLQLILTYRIWRGLSGRPGMFHLLAITQAVFGPHFGLYFPHKVAILSFLIILLSNAPANSFRVRARNRERRPIRRISGIPS